MIAFLDGLLAFKGPTNVIIDVHGVGYSVNISLQTYVTLPGGGDRLKLFIHHLFREDSQSLYGFASAAEKPLFLDLLGVTILGHQILPRELWDLQRALVRLSCLRKFGQTRLKAREWMISRNFSR